MAAGRDDDAADVEAPREKRYEHRTEEEVLTEQEADAVDGDAAAGDRPRSAAWR